MIRGTTPTFTFRLKNNDVDLTEARNMYVSIAQGAKTIEKTADSLEIDVHTVSVWLTQEESLKLTEGSNAEVQINWTYLDTDGTTVRRAATKVRSFPIDKQLLRRVIE